jgi:hypothetical protein
MTSNDQRMAALNKANRVRMARADVLRRLRAGVLPLEDALVHEFVATMQVYDFLRCVPYTNHSNSDKPRRDTAFARRALRATGCDPCRRVGDLTDRQRTVLTGMWRPVTGKGTIDGRPERAAARNAA